MHNINWLGMQLSEKRKTMQLYQILPHIGYEIKKVLLLERKIPLTQEVINVLSLSPKDKALLEKRLLQDNLCKTDI